MIKSIFKLLALPKSKTSDNSNYHVIAESDLFDSHWYWQQYADVAEAGVDPVAHYLNIGWREGREPGKLFNGNWYLQTNPDIKNARINPLLHYLKHGKSERRRGGEISSSLYKLISRSQFFDQKWYQNKYSDLLKRGVDPVLHYLTEGWRKGCNPSLRFDGNRYLNANVDVKKVGMNPLSHYELHGKKGYRRVFCDIENIMSDKCARPVSGSCALKSDMRPMLVHAHVYYPELWDELCSCIKNMRSYRFDLFVTLVEKHTEIERKIRADFPNAKIVHVENKGHDVGPFISVINDIDLNKYSYVVKLHTKRNVPEETDVFRLLWNEKWRSHLLSFISSPEMFQAYLEAFERNPTLGMQNSFALITNELSGDAKALGIVHDFLRQHGLRERKYRFVAGSMFIARAEIFAKLQELRLTLDVFDNATGNHGGQFSHAMERIIGYLAYAAGMTVGDGVNDPDGTIVSTILADEKRSVRTKREVRLCFYQRVCGPLSPQTVFYRLYSSPLLIPITILQVIKNGIEQTIAAISRRRRILRAKGKSTIDVIKHIKPVALYLPQYHMIPENDEWWGEGFTEWTNVRKAQPLFKGHYQPHVPHEDVGYYDLADVNVMRKQAKMAKKYGLHGFCFYYYHFAEGKRLLEKPLNNYLAAKDINFPFCYAWANENWTRAWDGGDKEVICPQDYEEENMMRMLNDMLPAFKDKRYIKIDGKPVLFVYRAEIIPRIAALADKWRLLAKDAGLKGLYLISMQHFMKKNPQDMGFDAAAEFSPEDGAPICEILSDSEIDFASKHNVNYLSMESLIRRLTFADAVPYPRIKCVGPSWDNSPRRGENASRILYHVCPNMFKKFFRYAVYETIDNNLPCDGMLLINAWNEWGEGAHLEPDKKYGYGFLEAIRDVLSGK